MSGRHTLRINRRADGLGHHVELDGQDIANSVLGLSLDLKGGYETTATLHLVLDEAPTETDQVSVRLPDATHELLVRLGWTPPAEEATP